MTAGHHLAQLNVALPIEPLTSARLQDFVDLLDPVNTLAESSPGFVWRLKEDTGAGAAGDATAIRLARDERLIVNLTVWETPEALADFVFGGLHVEVVRRRREWFAHLRQAYTCCWWVTAGSVPTVEEAEERLALLEVHGPTPTSFTLQRRFGPPEHGGVPLPDDDRFCPA